jgi:biotin carboxylase
MSEHQPFDLVTLDFSDPDACAREMLEFSKTHAIDGIIGVDDQVIAATSAIASALSLPHNPIEAAYATRNKHTMRRALAAADVPQPGFQLFPTDADPQRAADSVSYPCVIKPLMMSASRGVIRADSPRDFTEAFRRVSSIVGLRDAPVDEGSRTQLLVEDYVPGWEVAVEGVLTGGQLHVFTIFEKPDPLEGPYFPETIYLTPSELPAKMQERIRLLTQDAVRDLGLV